MTIVATETTSGVDLHDARVSYLQHAVEHGLTLREIGQKIPSPIGPISREAARQILHRFHLHGAWMKSRKAKLAIEKQDTVRKQRLLLHKTAIANHVAMIYTQAGYDVDFDPLKSNALYIEGVPTEVHVCKKITTGRYYRVVSYCPTAVRVAIMPTGNCMVLAPRFDKIGSRKILSYINKNNVIAGHNELGTKSQWQEWRTHYVRHQLDLK